MPPGPLRLLELAKAATQDIDESEDQAEQDRKLSEAAASTSGLGGSDPCPDVQRALNFLLDNSTPQVPHAWVFWVEPATFCNWSDVERFVGRN